MSLDNCPHLYLPYFDFKSMFVLRLMRASCKLLGHPCLYGGHTREPADSDRWQHVERSGSGVELRTLVYENPGSNPGSGVKTLGKFFHSTLPQFTQLNK